MQAGALISPKRPAAQGAENDGSMYLGGGGPIDGNGQPGQGQPGEGSIPSPNAQGDPV